MERSPLTREALAFADQRHAGQKRDLDDLPFVTHPVEVACLLHEAGYADEVVAAGVLHDVVEDTDAELSDLEAHFGSRVAELVQAVTDDPSIEDDAERKAALRRQVAAAGECAAVIFAADKVSKAREFRVRDEPWTPRRGGLPQVRPLRGEPRDARRPHPRARAGRPAPHGARGLAGAAGDRRGAP